MSSIITLLLIVCAYLSQNYFLKILVIMVDLIAILRFRQKVKIFENFEKLFYAVRFLASGTAKAYQNYISIAYPQSTPK